LQPRPTISSPPTAFTQRGLQLKRVRLHPEAPDLEVFRNLVNRGRRPSATTTPASEQLTRPVSRASRRRAASCQVKVIAPGNIPCSSPASPARRR
jgi:hypothetical protein